MGDFNPNFSGVGGGVAAAKSTSHTHMISQKPIPRGKLQIEIPIDD